jgi:CRISPR-associated endonuclease/helicase Cas3
MMLCGRSVAFDFAKISSGRVYSPFGERHLEGEASANTMPAHCDLLAQTSPVPAADPEPALFLHGERQAAEVQIVWRADRDPDNPDSWATTIEVLPPTRGSLAVTIAAARSFLSATSPAEVADIEGSGGRRIGRSRTN